MEKLRELYNNAVKDFHCTKALGAALSALLALQPLTVLAADEVRGPSGTPRPVVTGGLQTGPSLPTPPKSVGGIEDLAPIAPAVTGAPQENSAAPTEIAPLALPAPNAISNPEADPIVEPVAASLEQPAETAPLGTPKDSSKKSEDKLSTRVWTEAESLGFARGAPKLDDGVAGAESEPARLPRRAPSNRVRRAFLASLLVAQIGVETAGLAVPQLANKLAGNFSNSSWLATVSFAALAVGSLLAGPAVDRLGVRKVYLASLVLRTAAGAALADVYRRGALGLTELVALFGADWLAMGGSRVAEGLVPTEFHGSAQGKVTNFTTFQNMVIEGMGILGLTTGGVILATYGFGAALAAYPILVAASGLLLFRYLKFGPRGAASAAPLKDQIRGVLAALRGNRLLRHAVAAYSLSTMLSGILYFTISPNFSLFAASSGWSAPLLNWLTSLLYALGGVCATLTMAWLYRRHERRLETIPAESRAGEDHGWLKKLTSRWAALAGFVALCGGVMALTPWLGPIPALLFMIPFGLADAALFISAESLIKTEAPEAVRGSVLGIVRAGALLLTAASFPLLGAVFEHFSTGSGAGLRPTAGAFAVLAGALAAAGAVYLRIARRLKTPPRADAD